MTQQEFEFEPLNQNERAILHTLFCHLAVEGETEFTSDNLRELGLDKMLYGDPSKAIGLLFGKMKHEHLAEDTGRRKPSTWPSNHDREIKVYKMTVKGV